MKIINIFVVAIFAIIGIMLALTFGNVNEPYQNDSFDESPGTYPIETRHTTSETNVAFPNAANVFNINECNTTDKTKNNKQEDSMGIFITYVVNANGDTNKNAFLFRRPLTLLNNKDNYDIEVKENDTFAMPNQIGLILLDNK